MANSTDTDIVYTTVDEAPELASASLLPIVRAFAAKAGISLDTKDISLAGRIIAAFPERLTDAQKQDDHLAELGQWIKTAEANVIKLPNISASVPQLSAAIEELQQMGFDLPDYRDEPTTDEEKDIRARYDAIKGSAVNPVLREGNSNRRAASAVKNFAKANPHPMGTWFADSKTRVAFMEHDDFFSNETSTRLTEDATVRIELVAKDGTVTVLKNGIAYPAGAVVDATFMSASALDSFLATEIKKTKEEGILWSLHMKATMMKVSDPIIFGHAVKAWLAPVFDQYGGKMAATGVDPNQGLGDLLARVKDDAEIMAAIDAAGAANPPLYMVNPDTGITNLHVPSDVIIDASMPALIRAGGKGWGPDGKEQDCVCVIPDGSYAPVYDETITYFKETGALDPATSGTVENIGLMAQKAEEYGSHPTTFEIPVAGVVRMITDKGIELHQHTVAPGDIWRASSVRQAPIKDWVRLAIERQKAENCQAIFWLDAQRAHDAQLINYVTPILKAEHVAHKFKILAPRAATRLTLETIRNGENSIAITGNVLRDYLTDLFPILELGTSAKMLSIVKLMQGGGLFETGAGGTAPKHVQQLLEENHLRWDSLGEFCALGESLTFLANAKRNAKAAVLGKGVDAATRGILDHNRSPGRKVGQPDNRDSHYWFARYWAEALVTQIEDTDLAAVFAPLAAALAAGETDILAELAAVRGKPVDIGGYYKPDSEKMALVMRPSATLNRIIG
ncbi:MAG: NADP-dependent isocitrate dehydrogenase [Rhodobacteraceae bacterium]|nr:NADP-dependent isocitrate dehydrogenase [Paracoccaceae bacterium]